VYILLYIASGNASRQAHKVVGICGSEERAARSLWGITAIVFAVVAVFAYEDYLWPVVVSLAVLHVIQNVWRPILITRLDARGAQLQGATLLSLESQSRRLATMALAPLIGWAVDEVARRGLGGSYWPIGVAGFLVAAAFFMWPRDHEEAVAQSY